MKIRFTAALCLLALLAGLCAQAGAAGLHVKAAVLADRGTGEVLYEQNAKDRIPPASLTKILTLYVIYQEVEAGRVSMDDVVTVSRKAALTGGSSMHIKHKEQLTLGELVKGIAVASGNDACVAAAEHVAGSERDFVKRMNRAARSLGLHDSFFVNSHGLPARKQITTAADMLTLATKYIQAYPDRYDMHSIQEMAHNKKQSKNSNALLKTCYGVDGLKTGYVAASGFNVVITANRGDTRLLAVVLGGKTSAIRNNEAVKLVEAGFALAGSPARSLSPDQIASVFFAPSVLPSLPPSKASQAAYVIQESSWRSSQDAWKRAKELQQAGIPAQVITANLGAKGLWHRVVIGGFANLSQARQAKKILQKDHGVCKTIIVPANT